MIEYAFVLIKPDHVDIADNILNELDDYGTRRKTIKVDSVPREIIENHYSHNWEKFFFEYMADYFIGKPVVIAIYEGENIIQKLREVAGPTDPIKASKSTIRGKYSNDSLEKAIDERRPVKNVIHVSDSQDEAIREVRAWSRYY